MKPGVHASQQYCDDLNAVLPNCTGTGAFWIGVVSAFAFAYDLEPPRELMEAVKECQEVCEVEKLFKDWKRLRCVRDQI